MANSKISDLTAQTTLASTDMLPVANAAGTTKKITGANLKTDVLSAAQPLDSDLTAIAALTTTSYGRALLALADAAALRTTGGLVIGTNVSAADVVSKNGQAGILAPTARGWTTAATSFTNGRVMVSRFCPSVNFTVTSIKFRTISAGTGNVDVGIYDSTLTSKLRSSGSTSGKKGANTTQTVNLSATLDVVAGTVYYVAIVSDTSDGTVATPAFTVAIESLFGATAGLSEGGIFDTTFPLPSSVTLTTSPSFGVVAALV